MFAWILADKQKDVSVEISEEEKKHQCIQSWDLTLEIFSKYIIKNSWISGLEIGWENLTCL